MFKRLSSGPSDVLLASEQLDRAIQRGDLELAKSALKNRQVLNRPLRGVSPLMRAALAWLHHGSADSSLVDLLLKKGAWKGLTRDEQQTWLVTLVKDPEFPQSPRDLNIGGPERLIALMDKLTAQGLDVNGVNAAGETALFEAVRRGDRRWTMALVAVGVNPAQPRHDGRYPHDMGIDQPHVQSSPLWQEWLNLMRDQIRATERQALLQKSSLKPSGRRLRG